MRTFNQRLFDFRRPDDLIARLGHAVALASREDLLRNDLGWAGSGSGRGGVGVRHDDDRCGWGMDGGRVERWRVFMPRMTRWAQGEEERIIRRGARCAGCREWEGDSDILNRRERLLRGVHGSHGETEREITIGATLGLEPTSRTVALPTCLPCLPSLTTSTSEISLRAAQRPVEHSRTRAAVISGSPTSHR